MKVVSVYEKLAQNEPEEIVGESSDAGTVDRLAVCNIRKMHRALGS